MTGDFIFDGVTFDVTYVDVPPDGLGRQVSRNADTMSALTVSKRGDHRAYTITFTSKVSDLVVAANVAAIHFVNDHVRTEDFSKLVIKAAKGPERVKGE